MTQRPYPIGLSEAEMIDMLSGMGSSRGEIYALDQRTRPSVVETHISRRRAWQSRLWCPEEPSSNRMSWPLIGWLAAYVGLLGLGLLAWRA